MYTLSAEAHAAANDTVRLARATDSIGALAARSAFRREQFMVRHARGLLARARADTTQAIAEFRGAIYSPTLGFTRSNRNLAELLIARRRPGEAIPMLRAALHGTLDNVQLYVTRTELHELLAQAFAAQSQSDSAAVHFGHVAAALANADPHARRRLQRALMAAAGRRN